MNVAINQQGLSLVEVMVSLVIGLFLTVGITQVFLTTHQANRTQENVSRMQENARFAMHFLINDIRQAGFFLSPCGDENILETAYNHLAFGDASNAQYQYGSFQGISGENDTGVNDSDRISVLRIPFLSTGVDVSAASVSAPLTSLAASGWEKDTIVLVTDCITADIFQKTNAASHSQLAHETGGTHTPGNKNQSLTRLYTTNAKAYVLSKSEGLAPTVYEVKNDGLGVPGLTQNNEQIVANIENMQILYGERLADGKMYYVPAGTDGLDMSKVLGVKVSLLVRSPDDNVSIEPQEYIFNGASKVATDNRLRKVYTSTITLRNRLN